MAEYYGDSWKEILATNNLDSFDKIWDLKTDWFEEPNIRRGGWSGVVKVNLETVQETVGVFIKRQENHITKTPLHPIKGRPTFEREFKNILRLRRHKVPTLEPVYFSKRNKDGDLQAILITKELSDYISLDSDRFLTDDLIKNTAQKNSLLKAVANTLRKMHHHHFQHNCFYLKHVFVKPEGDSWDVKIIDLEKLKWSFFKKNAVFRDLFTLHRHAQGWSKKEHVKLFKFYVEESKLSNKSKALWRLIEKKVLSKRK
ncbi:MAG: lipopolysaccharide kinase [Methylophaga sp.]|nr:lipopolysaccharide kinase [Methylophaga sp.]